MIDQSTKRSRYPFDAIALAIAGVIAGCGTPLMPDPIADETTSPPAKPTALPTEAVAREASPYDRVAEYSARRAGRALVVVEGSGKELERDLNAAVADLTRRLREHAAVHAVVPTMSTDARGRFSYALKIDSSLRPAAASDDAADEPEGV